MQISALASMEWLHQLFKELGFEWNLSESLFYNVSLSLSVFACEEDSMQASTNRIEVERSTIQPQDSLSFFIYLASFFTATNNSHVLLQSEDLGCTSVFQYSGGHSVSFFLLLWLSLFGFMTLVLLCCLLIKMCSTSNKIYCDHVPESALEENPVVEHVLEGKDSETLKKSILLERSLTLYLSKGDKICSLHHSHSIEKTLDGTIGRFLKELDFYLSVEISPVNRAVPNPSLSSPSSSLSSLTSPRLSKKFPLQSRQSPKSLPGLNIKRVDEFDVQCWIKFEELKQQLNWNYPGVHSDDFDYGQMSTMSRNLCVVLQFLQQNCLIKPQQWTLATTIVNYTLFILGDMLKSGCEDEIDFLSFSKFESIGSAADGTIIGCANRFDVLMVLDVVHCSEMNILHSNAGQDIPAGFVAISLKDCDSALQNVKSIKKACIQNQFGQYLVPEDFKAAAETMLKKAILKLNRDFKTKLDNLPFCFHLSADKKLTVKIDTRLLNSLGLGVEEINIKVIPALKLSLPEFSQLSTIYVIPSWKDKPEKTQSTTFPKTALTRVFRDQNNEDLLWTLCTEKLKMSVIKYFSEKLHLSGVHSCHKECVKILKALFANGHKNKLLNKGEIDSVVLSTIVYFLIQESNPSCWTLANLPDRLSDAIHFLRSAYENNWLPNFLVHNPHLVTQCPSLEVLAPLLSGKQQNLLAHVQNAEVVKILDFINSRIQEAGLSQCIKEEFSSNMWEYEFFIFG